MVASRLIFANEHEESLMKKFILLSLMAFMVTGAHAFTEQYICQESDTLVTFKLNFNGRNKIVDSVVFNGDILSRNSYSLSELGYDPAAKGERFSIFLNPGYGAIRVMTLIRRDVTEPSLLLLNNQMSPRYVLRCKVWTRQ